MFGQYGCSPHQWAVDIDHIELPPQLVDLLDCRSVRRPAEPPRSPASGKRRPALHVAEHRRSNSIIARVPHRTSPIRAGLFDDQLHEHRRVDVGDHRRCSATRSLTVPVAVTPRAGRLRSRTSGRMHDPALDQGGEGVGRRVERNESGDRPTPVGDDEFIAVADAMEVPTQVVLQLANPDLARRGCSYIHPVIVATCCQVVTSEDLTGELVAAQQVLGVEHQLR